MKRTALAALVFAFGWTALGQDGKTELRYAFKKGEKFSFQIQHRVSAKIDKIPEFLQGIVSEEPIDAKFEGVVDVVVAGIAEDGTATLDGIWRTAKAKGHVFVNDIDFEYDIAKKGEEKPKKKEEPEDPALQGFGDLADQLGKMVRAPLKLAADRFGKISIVEGSGKLGEIESVFRSLNGLMGPLPKDAVGKGSAWKDETKLGMPGVGGNVELRIRTDNTIDAVEKVDGRDCLVVKSKYVVGKTPGEKDDANGPDIGAKVRTEGEGDGRTLISPEGRALKSQSNLRIKLTVTIPNPGGGEDIDLKAMVKIDTGHAQGK